MQAENWEVRLGLVVSVTKEPVAHRTINIVPHHTTGLHVTPRLEVSMLMEQWADGHTGAAMTLMLLGVPSHPKEPKLMSLWCRIPLSLHPSALHAIFFQFLFGG